MITVTFNGGPLAGEFRVLPDERPPARFEILVPEISPPLYLAAESALTPITISTETFAYIRHSHDCQTDVTVYVPEGEFYDHRNRGPSPPHIKHWTCRPCDVRWYGTRICWNCGQETGT